MGGAGVADGWSGGGSGGGSGNGGASSSRSDADAAETSDAPMAVAVPIPEAIEPTLTLSANTRRLLEARLSRRLLEAEAQRLDEALGEALSVLQAGGAEARQQLLTSLDMATALLEPGAAMLWACVTETATTEASASSVAAFTAALEGAASTVAGALFASAFGV